MSTTTPRLRKGEATRLLILERAAPVFNQRGYAGASMSELVEATGIEKGGIYNHFGSKEDLAVESFDYSISLIVDGYAAVQEGKVGLDRLEAIIEIFGNWSGHPLVAGGGPVQKPPPQARGEVDGDVDPYELATLVTSTLEGSLMLTRLFDDPAYKHRAVASLIEHVESLRNSPRQRKGRANRCRPSRNEAASCPGPPRW